MLLIATTAYSQDNRTNEYKKLIDSAISIFIRHIDDNFCENSSKEELIIYLIDEQSKQIDISNVKSRLSLRTIDINDKKNRNLLRKGLKISQVRPIFNNNILTVNIVNYLVSYKDKTFHFVNSGGSAFFFQYSCEQKKWVLSKVEHTSI